jgi:hypothetical protein
MTELVLATYATATIELPGAAPFDLPAPATTATIDDLAFFIGLGGVGGAAVWGDITGTLTDQTDLAAELADKATAAQGALADSALQPGAQIPWTDVTSKPATFAPSAHVHAQADVTGLVTALADKANTGHSHAIADTTGLQSALDGKQPLSAVLTATTASFTTADEAKLDGIAPGAEVNVPTNLTYTAATRVLASDTGTDATLPLVTSDAAGLAPASGGGTATFLRADGTWAAPPGGGGGGAQVFFQQTRPVEAGPWTWWVTDSTGKVINLVLNDGV